MNPELDPRLKALHPIVAELKKIRSHLVGPKRSGVLDERAIRFVEDALARIEPHLHAGKWPPVWWRLSGMNLDAVPRYFRRVDADGGYLPERNNILECVDRIDDIRQAMQHAPT